MESESHPSKVNQGPGRKSSASKEGLSVYGIFQRFAYSPQRRNQLKQFFLRPSTDIDVIRERHAFIGVYLRPDNNNPLNKLTKSLKHIKNLRHVMVNLRKGISTGSGKITGLKTTVWATLLAFAFYGIDIHDALKETAAGNELALLHKALRIFEAAQLYRVGRMIQDIVDIDSTEEQGRAVVKRGLDREIDELKDSYDGLSSLLQKVAVEIAGTISKSLGIGVNNEFGKGTNESDGIGLICGILKHLLEVENSPKVIAATHFHETLENEFLKPGPRLMLGHMEVQVSEECRSAQDQITYLYNFRLGWCDKSYGPICAALNGINETIVERANELASLAVRGENLTAACAMLSDEEMHTLEEADILARKFSSLELSSKESSGKVNDMLNMLVEETNGGGIA
ncbi:hypothetical protein ETB97_007584 [Aspergillus alliaceus]|uniref:DNA mismatch repair proteins mutS family domain-containing protein n=1 Tax=Petromyces alliaceus TaxID=209559 RepID=A0A8H6EB73_PETAA|nr:hypothetical protein ETB97_007584 [Aspergillus burnettii]